MRVTLLVLTFLSLSSGVQASEERPYYPLPSMPVLGYMQLCANKPLLPVCVADKAIEGATPAHELTTLVMEQIESVNWKINEQITPVTDKEKYKVTEEFWNAETKEGDCEEFVLAKKDALLALGFTASQLLITVVLEEKFVDEAIRNREVASGGGTVTTEPTHHLVLMVRTSGGNFILDNLTDQIRRMETMSHHLVKHQSPYNPDEIWISHNSFN